MGSSGWQRVEVAVAKTHGCLILCVAVCYSALHCVGVSCCELQYVFSALQCVAVVKTRGCEILQVFGCEMLRVIVCFDL